MFCGEHTRLLVHIRRKMVAMFTYIIRIGFGRQITEPTLPRESSGSSGGKTLYICSIRNVFVTFFIGQKTPRFCVYGIVHTLALHISSTVTYCKNTSKNLLCKHRFHFFCPCTKLRRKPIFLVDIGLCA